MESYMIISFLNDFMFCPRSIYFHQLYSNYSKKFYQTKVQIKGLNAHKTIDNKEYSTKKDVLQGIDIYSNKYGLCGKIDILDIEKETLIERKKLIKVIYDGYIFQVYAQYYCLIEMGYKVSKINLYSMDTNKTYKIPLPEEDKEMNKKFEKVVQDIREFDLEKEFIANKEKCKKCIYNNLCDEAILC